jgi:3-phosphoshikimate 1-carboxyvinyltransferase
LRRTKSNLEIDGILVSKPYVDVTIDVLEWAGIRIDQPEPGSHYVIPAGQRFVPSMSTYRVPGDYSSAAFLLAAACLVPSRVTVRDLKPDDKQGDREIVKILRNMGATLFQERDSITISGPISLRGIELDCSEIPDLVPILCVLGAFAQGRTVLKNIAHLRHKETDRLAGPTEELTRMGARISHSHNSITVEHSRLIPATVNARGDHRLAMSLIVAGLGASGVEVAGAPSMNKSYPAFVKDMQGLGAKISSAET